MGKILRVDLSTGKSIDLNLPEEPFLRKYWGGQLFADIYCSTSCRLTSIHTTRKT